VVIYEYVAPALTYLASYELAHFSVHYLIALVQIMKSTIFWDGTRSSSVEDGQCFGGKYCFHLQSRGISQLSTQNETGYKVTPVSCWLPYSSALKMAGGMFRLCLPHASYCHRPEKLKPCRSTDY
jgi:hypothetical protein